MAIQVILVKKKRSGIYSTRDLTDWSQWNYGKRGGKEEGKYDLENRILLCSLEREWDKLETKIF